MPCSTMKSIIVRSFFSMEWRSMLFMYANIPSSILKRSSTEFIPMQIVDFLFLFIVKSYRFPLYFSQKYITFSLILSKNCRSAVQFIFLFPISANLFILTINLWFSHGSLIVNGRHINYNWAYLHWLTDLNDNRNTITTRVVCWATQLRLTLFIT